MQSRKRELTDNLTLRNKQKEIELKQREIRDLEREIGDLDVTRLEAEKNRLHDQQENLRKDVSAVQGRECVVSARTRVWYAVWCAARTQVWCRDVSVVRLCKCTVSVRT